MITKELTIKNEIGLHARPAALFVQTANKFLSDIMIKRSILHIYFIITDHERSMPCLSLKISRMPA